MCASSASASGSRAPHGGVLQRYLRERFPGFLESRLRDGRSSFMLADVNAFLACGDIRQSNATLRCFKCHVQRTIPLSCKRRGFCEPCAVRRQITRGWSLQREVFGTKPVRLWTMTLPFPFRIEAGFDSGLLTKILDVVIKSLFRYVRITIKRLLKLRYMNCVYPASVTVIHRTSRHLGPNIHFHCLLVDGAFVRRADGAPLEFVDLPPPTDDQIADLSRTVCKRVRYMLWRDNVWDDLPATNGEIAGVFVTKDGRAAKCRIAGIAAGQAAELPRGVTAFNLRASKSVRAGDRKNQRRLIKYLLAPPFSEAQLHPTDDGMILELPRPRSDGTTTWEYTHEEFLNCLEFTVPPQGANMIRFHGAFAPNCKFRAEAVPPPTPNGNAPTPNPDNGESPEDYAAWAVLKTHSFGKDVTKCPICQGRLQLIALTTDRMTYRRSGKPPDTPKVEVTT